VSRLAAAEIHELDPYKFMATIGKRVIHPGGRASTERLLDLAAIARTDDVLDIGCGVATTAIQIARRFEAHVTAADVSPLMLERAGANVRAAGLGERVTVEHADILDLPYGDQAFDVVLAEAVTMFVERERAASELTRVTRPGGRVLATEFFWRLPPTREAREVFLDEVCPGLEFDTIDDWVHIYRAGGLIDICTETGPFDMMTTRGFLADEGFAHSLAILGRVVGRAANVRKMTWLMPRMAKAVPYLGFIIVAARKPT
jgi:ubiquinone/menaquinone biosynthesis C-methylase UbiE